MTLIKPDHEQAMCMQGMESVVGGNGLGMSLYKILSITIFEQTRILEGFFNFADEGEPLNAWKQLNLFDF